MSAEEKNKLDEIFKSGLDVPDTHFEYNDQHWDNLEELMGGGKKRPAVVYLWPILSGVAALLLIVMGWWFFKPATTVDNTLMHAAVKPATTPQKLDNTTNSDSTKSTNYSNTNTIKKQQATVTTPTIPVYASVAHKSINHNGTKQNAAKANPSGVNGIIGQSNPVQEQPKKEILAANTSDNATTQSNNPVTDVNNPAKDVSSAITAPAKQEVIANVPVEKAATIEQPKKVKTSITGKGPQFGLAMMLSPDVNGAGSFQNAKVGTNIGLLFSVGVGKRLSISTGVAYSKKPYTTEFNNYYSTYQFKTNPQDVTADCRVLDIPLNVDYKVYNRGKNSFSVGSGLSSYIMLKETYNYNYTVPYTAGPTSVTYINRHQHVLGVLNLSATYERQLNSKFSFAAQPYLKVPLTDIGNSRVKLQSAGVALGLRWNINHSTTP
jgi:hypothetical protein